MSFFDEINTVLDNTLTEFVSGSSEFLLSAKIIAGLGCLISAYFTFFKMMEGNNEAIGKFSGRFLACFLGISFYGSFLGLLNLPLNAMSEAIKKVSIKSDSETHGFFSDMRNLTDDPRLADSEKDKKIVEYMGVSTDEITGKSSEESKSIFSTIMGLRISIKSMIIEGIYSIFHFLGQIAVLILNVIRTFFLIVLSIFGIFVIAFSMYPGLENSFYQWLQKYINVYLWLPIGYILQGIISKIYLIYNPIPGNKYWGEFITGSQINSENMVLAFISLCSIIAFATIPTMSSWIINAATNGVSSRMNAKTKQTAQAVRKMLLKK